MAKKLTRGKDWHGWVWKPDGGWPDGKVFYNILPDKAKYGSSAPGRWVRVKFVEVKDG